MALRGIKVELDPPRLFRNPLPVVAKQQAVVADGGGKLRRAIPAERGLKLLALGHGKPVSGFPRDVLGGQIRVAGLIA